MTDLRHDLKRLVESQSWMTSVLPASFVFLLIYPVLSLLGSIQYFAFYSVLSSVWYLLFLLGLLMCFAEEIDWAIGTAYAILAFKWLVVMIRNFSFNSIVYLAACAAVAVLFFRSLAAGGSQGADYVVHDTPPVWERPPVERPSQDQGGPSPFCSTCGKPIDPSGKFCPYCGTPYDSFVYTPPTQTPYTPVDRPRTYSGGGTMQDTVLSLCGSVLALVFSVLITANTVLSLAANFSVITLVTQIPAILICIGCWLAYMNGMHRQTSTSGLTILSGVLIYNLIAACVGCALTVLLSVAMIASGYDEFAEAGAVSLLLSVVLVLFFVFYWRGLRTSVVSARAILRGEAYEWKTSIFSIVCLCISAVWKVIWLMIFMGIQSMLGQLLNEIYYGIYVATDSSDVADMVVSYVSSLLGGGSSGLVTLNSVLSVAVIICGLVMLIQVRSRNAAGRM